MPEISVIIPCYNVEPYLEPCFRSLINQTFKDIELIFVDDGSDKDNTAAVLDSFVELDSRVRVIHKQNAGVGEARNTGMLAAKGEYIGFVDPDDLIPAEYYEVLYNVAKKYDADIAWTNIIRFYPEEFGREESYYTYFAEEKVLASREEKFAAMNMAGYVMSKIYRRTLLVTGDRHLFFNNRTAYEDIMFTAKVLDEANKVVVTPKTNYKYRYNPTSLTARKQNAELRRHYYEALKDIRSFLIQRDLPVPKEWRILRKWNIGIGGFSLLKAKDFGRYTLVRLFDFIPVWITFNKDFPKRKTVPTFPQISVLMPAYNSEKTIAEAIDSILSQTFRDFEFIIINDGSTDNTAKIVREYKDERIRFIDNDRNQGLVAVLNQGLDLCRGKYIARMDSDDISLPERFERQIEFMRRHKKVGILGTYFYIFGECNPRVETKVKYPKLSDMLVTSPVGHPTVMMRRDILLKYNLRYNPVYKYAEDYELWHRAIKYTRIANLEQVLLHYRWHGDNISYKHEDEQIQIDRVIKQKIRRAIGKTSNLVQITSIRDESILEELRKLGQFTYMPNSGNMGDALIASATMRWFDRNNIQYTCAKPDDMPENFVYGGGGAWIHAWIRDLEPVMNIMKQARRVVILPSSFDNVPEFVKILDSRFVVFCREKKSYDYLVTQKTAAKIILDHDMALRYGDVMPGNLISDDAEKFHLAENLAKAVKRLPGTVKMFRTDNESAGHYPTDIDLSDSMGWFGPYQSRADIDFAALTMLKTVSRFDCIHTDRLHVGIAGMLVGADVVLYDNNYGKISGVYEQSLTKMANITFSNKGGE